MEGHWVEWTTVKLDSPFMLINSSKQSKTWSNVYLTTLPLGNIINQSIAIDIVCMIWLKSPLDSLAEGFMP
jgi:hypothetical protein